MSRDSLSTRIWAGDENSVELARKSYESDPEGQFVPWVSTLYSFRLIPKYRQELIDLGTEIRKYTCQVQNTLSSADQADVLSTILLWLSEQQQDASKSSDSRGVARMIAEIGLQIADWSLGKHTAALLCTTMARLEGRPMLYKGYHLQLAKVLAPFIQDNNQRARVWKRIGALYLTRKNPIGFWYLARAFLTKGVPGAVRQKVLSFWHS